MDHQVEWVRFGDSFIVVGHTWVSFRLLGNKRSRALTISDFQVVTKHAETDCGPPFQAGLRFFRYAQKAKGRRQMPKLFTEIRLHYLIHGVNLDMV